MDLYLTACRRFAGDLYKFSDEICTLLRDPNVDWVEVAKLVDAAREPLIMLDLKSKKRVVLKDERWKDLDSKSVVQRGD